MKMPAFLLALYVITLAAAPMVDLFVPFAESACCSYACQGEPEGHDGQHDEGCNDMCNPFLSCHCCMGFDLPIVAEVLGKFPSSYYRRGAFSRFNSSQVVFSIWHPPKT